MLFRFDLTRYLRQRRRVHGTMQVIGYDPKRRMHRCAYDASGDKQWHDLANKQFEVVGQNGVAIRSSESAPY